MIYNKTFAEICTNVDEFMEGEIKLNASSLRDFQTIYYMTLVPFIFFITNLSILSRSQRETIYELYKELGFEEKIKEMSDIEEKIKS